jgi:aspartyl protease family protein
MPLRKKLGFIAIWMVLFFFCLLGYSFKSQASYLFWRVAGVIAPGIALSTSPGIVEIVRDNSMHFHVNASINGVTIPFLIDTGASNIALSYEDAKRIGIQPAELRFDIPIATASGNSLVAQIPPITITVGSITLSKIAASISKPGALDTSLLGMSFLNQLGSYSFEGDRLVFRAPVL